MARTLKTKGMEELTGLRRRIDRQFSLGRISRRDWEKLKRLGDELSATIVNMREINEYGEEEGEDEW